MNLEYGITIDGTEAGTVDTVLGVCTSARKLNKNRFCTMNSNLHEKKHFLHDE